MLHRVRAHMRFTANSGLATWARDNMQVRFEQAVHIRPGTATEEPPVNVVEDMGGNRHEFTCDLPLMDEAHAIDALATLSDANVLGQAMAIPDVGPSWVERHVCDHVEDVRSGCVVASREEQS